MEEKQILKNMVLILSKEETTALRGVLNASLTMVEAIAKNDSKLSQGALGFLVKLWTTDVAWESGYAKFLEGVHLAGMCEDPKCSYKFKANPATKGN